MLSVNISDENLFKETWKKQRSNYSNGNTLGGNMPRWKNYNIAKKKSRQEEKKRRKEETRSMNTCRIKGKKREEKENKIQIVPL